MRRSLPAVLLLLLLAVSIGALTLSTPAWLPAAPYTNNTLNCSWEFSADTVAQNITILRNGVVFNSTYQNASTATLDTSALIPPANTTKGDVWTCRIMATNGTASSTKEVNVTILNSPPVTEGSPAGIFNASGTDVGYLIQIPEDSVLVIDVNATDGDNDTITYLQAEEFCSRTSSSAGTYNCSPTQDDLSGNQPTQYNITFTASDGQNVGGRTIVFNVTPVNDAPALSLANQTVAVNATLNYTFSASDVESSYPLTYQLIFNASNSDIQDRISLARLNADGTSMSLVYSGTGPDFSDVGYWPLFINVTDNSTGLQGQNDSQHAVYLMYLNITSVGRRPYFASITPTGPYNLSQGEAIQINISANDPDANSTLSFTDDTARFAVVTTNAHTNTTNATAQVNFTPTNDDVGVYNVTITVTDLEGLTNTTILQFNVSNINDAPTVHERSFSAANTQGNTNASNLSAYANAQFTYDVNATDPDAAYGDTLTYGDNTSLFDINSSTGRIQFTPTNAQTGTYHVNISAVDGSGAHANRTLVLVINTNSPPRFNVTPLPQLNCTTGAACSFALAGVTVDPDAGDSVASYSVSFIGSSIGSFGYNATSGLINFTVTKYDVGNYTVNITINDTFGATNSSLMNISINNTPVAPVLTRYNFSDETIVETHPFTYELRATDDDYLVSSAAEAVNFTTNLSISHSITPLATSNITARATLSFTPEEGDEGNHTVQINATDAFGLVSTQVITFEIHADVPPPNITNITPWGQGATYDIQTTYASTADSQFSGNIARVNMTENVTVLFNVTVNDTRPVTYNWSVNGTAVTSAANYTRAFNFTSSGEYLVRVNVSNDRLEHTVWTWNVTVRNVNRGPQLINALPNRTSVNTTETTTNYFVGGSSTVRFYDPDDDLNGNGYLDGNETNTMTFSTASSCSYATIGVSGTDLVITPTDIGSCEVRFNATDAGGLSVASDLVLINVTDVPEGDTEDETVTSSGGGGGSSSTSTYIPITNDRETPRAFRLIAPRLVTVYSNESIVIPITVNNTWHTPLRFLRLVAETNATGVSTEFDVDLFEEIPVNESRDVTLTVANYRLGSNYEVRVLGNVTDPSYQDEALILLNSIESATDGDQVRVKVTFANDLLSEHPECQELSEILDEAQELLSRNDVAQAARLVDGVINGCKYLVSTQQADQERPTRLNPIINIDSMPMETVLWSVLAFVVLLSTALLALYHYTHKPEDDI